MIMKRPSMRSAKIDASATVARNSDALMRVEVEDRFGTSGQTRWALESADRVRCMPREAYHQPQRGSTPYQVPGL